MDELDLRLDVHMMDIANEKGWSVIILHHRSNQLQNRHYVFNVTQYSDEDVARIVKERGVDTHTIDFRNHFD